MKLPIVLEGGWKMRKCSWNRFGKAELKRGVTFPSEPACTGVKSFIAGINMDKDNNEIAAGESSIAALCLYHHRNCVRCRSRRDL